MSNAPDSDARCLKAIELTFRFVLKRFVLLALFLVGVCLLFGGGYRLSVNIGLAIVVLYFIVAYRHVGHSDRGALIVAGLAGLTAANAAAEAHSANGVGASSMEFNPATEEMSGDDTLMFDVNPASGLPMMNDMIDIHGNAFGTTSD